MNCTSILAFALALASTLVPCFARSITPTEAHSRHNVPEKLNAVSRQTRCDSKTDCPGDMSCVNINGACDTSGCAGFCIDLIRCSCSEPCDGNNMCVTIGQGSQFSVTTCFPDFVVQGLGNLAQVAIDCDKDSDGSEGEDGSEEPNNSDEGTEQGSGMGSDEEGSEPACIGVESLQDFASHQLVFEKHALARVLCDTASSCATKGHMVNYKGKIMMMGTYCDIVGCEQKVMQVNSPKYQRGLKVESRSPDMYFTAFAARYGTNVEEAVLAAAVRVGL